MKNGLLWSMTSKNRAVNYFKNNLLEIGLIGSRDDVTTFFRTKEKQIYVRCGCFYGDVDEFAAAVAKTHGDSKHGKVYRVAIEMAKVQIEDVY